MKKFSIRFNLKKSKPTDDKPILLRYSFAGERLDVYTGQSVSVKNWDAVAERAKRNTTNGHGIPASLINRALSDLESSLVSFIDQSSIASGELPSKDEVRAFLVDLLGRSSSCSEKPDDSFWVRFDEFTRVMGERNEWTESTFKKFRTIKAHLQGYDKTATFDGISELWLQGFVKYLLKCGLRNVTVQKDFSFLRWFLRWAHKMGYSQSMAQESFVPKLKGTDGNCKEVIFLDWDELMLVYSFVFDEKHSRLAEVRDIFCFCCFTGLRFSDVKKLKVSDVKDGFIEVVTQKTTDGLRIELNDYSRAILERYKDRPSPGGCVFPVSSNQRMNDRLKEIGRMVGLNSDQRVVFYVGNVRHEEVHKKWELLSTHCGRRTFVVNALTLGIAPEVIMKWTGHSDFKAMRPYVKIVDSLKAASMEKFNKK